MSSIKLTTAIGTPLNEDESLHEEGLRKQLADQWNHGIDGVLSAGSMGAMQLLTDDTYRRLIEISVEESKGKGELLVGAGDCGYARTRDRISFINNYDVDGVAVLAPFFWGFSQDELFDYYTELADHCKAPLYLYDLPQVTGTKISLDVILRLAKHPNIKGAKLSGPLPFTQKLLDSADPDFRIIVANPDLMDTLMRSGINEHLDGMWAICPKWTVNVVKAAQQGDWEAAAKFRKKVVDVRDKCLGQQGVWAFTVLMNARGIPGDFMPRPFKRYTQEQTEKMLSMPLVQELLADDPAVC